MARPRSFWICRDVDQRLSCVQQSKRILNAVQFIELWNETVLAGECQDIPSFLNRLIMFTQWSPNRILSVAEKYRNHLIPLGQYPNAVYERCSNCGHQVLVVAQQRCPGCGAPL